MVRCFCRHLLTKLAQFLEKFPLQWTTKFYPILFHLSAPICLEKMQEVLLQTFKISASHCDGNKATDRCFIHMHFTAPAPLNQDAQTELNQWEGTRRNFDAVFNALTHSPDAQESANSDTEYPWAPIDPTRTLKHTRWARAQLGPRTSGSAAKVPLRADPLVSPLGVCLRLTVADRVRLARASRGSRSPLIDCVYVAQLARHGMFLRRRRHIPVK